MLCSERQGSRATSRAQHQWRSGDGRAQRLVPNSDQLCRTQDVFLAGQSLQTCLPHPQADADLMQSAFNQPIFGFQ